MSDSSYKTDVDDDSETTIQCPHFYRSGKEHEKYDMIANALKIQQIYNDKRVHICSIAISTVMMMASHSYKDITTENLKYMEMYFQNLKEEDRYPHNITCILQILENLEKSGIIKNAKVEGTDMEANEDDI